MRKKITESEIFSTIYAQLEKMDITNWYSCPLINGGCGLGKTSALLRPEIYELFSRKLQKEPRVLFIESRSATRDQIIEKQLPSTYKIIQYSNIHYDKNINENYDIIIIDEAHSIFVDSPFAEATTELFEWLIHDCKIFQIYITASDIEFINFLEHSELQRELNLTFPNLEEEHVRFVANEMRIILSTKKTKEIIDSRINQLFTKGNRGILFIQSAADAAELYMEYSTNYRCGFYISQRNKSTLMKELKNEKEVETLLSYTKTKIEISVLKVYQNLEITRERAGLPSIRDSLIEKGKIPDDIDFLFLTDVAQEGVSLSADNKLDFIFIEDTYPLTINQKIFRYRANPKIVYLSLPQRRIEQMLKNTANELLTLLAYTPEQLEAFYHGAKRGNNAYKKVVWRNTRTGIWEVRKNYITFVTSQIATYNEIRGAIQSKDCEKLLSLYGNGARKVLLESQKEKELENNLEKLYEKWKDIPIYGDKKEEFTKDCKEAGIVNARNGKEYTFRFLAMCKNNEFLNLYHLAKKKARKKDVAVFSYLKIKNDYYVLEKIQ